MSKTRDGALLTVQIESLLGRKVRLGNVYALVAAKRAYPKILLVWHRHARGHMNRFCNPSSILPKCNHYVSKSRQSRVVSNPYFQPSGLFCASFAFLLAWEILLISFLDLYRKENGRIHSVLRDRMHFARHFE